MTISSQNNDSEYFCSDSLLCEEVFFDPTYSEEDGKIVSLEEEKIYAKEHNSTFPLVLGEDLISYNEELIYLFCKEKQNYPFSHDIKQIYSSSASTCIARGVAIDWMLKVKGHFRFSALTAMLCINYFDRYMLSSLEREDHKVHLALLTCLSLAAKVNEVKAPHLVDLQVEYPKFVFKPISIKDNEIAVMTSLNWRMHSVTPLSFVDHIIGRLGLETNLQWEIYKKSEDLILSFVAGNYTTLSIGQKRVTD